MDPEQKYQDLFLLAKDKLKTEKERYFRIDDKINRLFNVLTLILGIGGFFGKWIIDNFLPPNSILEWLIFGTTILIFLSLTTTWLLILSGDKLLGLQSPRLSDKLLDTVKEYEPIDIYFAMAKKYQEALKYNRIKTDDKIWYLEKAHYILRIIIGELVIISTLYLIYKWK